MKIITLVLGLALAGSVFAAAPKDPMKTPAVSIQTETIQGTLVIVDRDASMIYLKSAEGYTYDFKIVGTTRILSGERKLTLDDLQSQVGKPIEVVFRPLRSGNIASKIEFK